VTVSLTRRKSTISEEVLCIGDNTEATAKSYMRYHFMLKGTTDSSFRVSPASKNIATIVQNINIEKNIKENLSGGKVIISCTEHLATRREQSVFGII
jgi:hypothetical protein